MKVKVLWADFSGRLQDYPDSVRERQEVLIDYPNAKERLAGAGYLPITGQRLQLLSENFALVYKFLRSGLPRGKKSSTSQNRLHGLGQITSGISLGDSAANPVPLKILVKVVADVQGE